jgi:hypothetical protein
MTVNLDSEPCPYPPLNIWRNQVRDAPYASLA